MKIEVKTQTDGLAELAQSILKLQGIGQSDEVRQALRNAGQVVVTGQQALVAQRARSHPRGQLKDAVTATQPYVNDFEAGIKFGWKETAIRGNKSVYVDGRGRRRKVNTVADYAAILEYSSSRQLRHLEEGFDDTEAAALDKLEAAVDAAIAKCMK